MRPKGSADLLSNRRRRARKLFDENLPLNEAARRLLKTEGRHRQWHRTELWTTKRVAEVIRRTFHVPCHFNNAGLHPHRFGWTHQKPEQRALERDEKAIER
jgi:transposase